MRQTLMQLKFYCKYFQLATRAEQLEAKTTEKRIKCCAQPDEAQWVSVCVFMCWKIESRSRKL